MQWAQDKFVSIKLKFKLSLTRSCFSTNYFATCICIQHEMQSRLQQVEGEKEELALLLDRKKKEIDRLNGRLLKT